MEGPASEEAERRADAAAEGREAGSRAELVAAVFGSTPDNHEPHFLGWRSEIDPALLFAAGRAWGLTVRRIAP
jgi:hypothetical protein